MKLKRVMKAAEIVEKGAGELVRHDTVMNEIQVVRGLMGNAYIVYSVYLDNKQYATWRNNRDRSYEEEG